MLYEIPREQYCNEMFGNLFDSVMITSPFKILVTISLKTYEILPTEADTETLSRAFSLPEATIVNYGLYVLADTHYNVLTQQQDGKEDGTSTG